MQHNEQILVTGAGGFIGGWIVESLYLTGERNVRAGIRNWSGAARLGRFPFNIVPCDISSPAQIMGALDGVTCVIHCAKGSDESIFRGTANMLEAALKQGVRRFVYISTTEVYGNPSGDVIETAPCRATGIPYTDNKIKAEELCWEYLRKGLAVTVLRPPIVYGPFSKTWTLDIALRLLSGNWGIFKRHADGVCNLLYVSDLVSAVLLAARDPRSVGQAFNVNGPERLTWNQYFEKFNLALCLPPLKSREPVQAKLRASVMEPVRSCAKFAKVHYEAPIRRIASKIGPAKQAMKYVEGSLKTAPRTADFDLYQRNAFYSPAKARELLDFAPRIKIDQGLGLSVEWLDQVGILDRPAT